ncbi:MAG: hypothetical protein H0T76_00925 [Nannocystis sp.]|nr:hypothetical protein [Nannocystis sp.]MBA3545023.1 hypothetical protein [Nannocystis sp.]
MTATDDDVGGVETVLRRFPELAHLRVRRRAALLTIESGEPNDPLAHARLRRVAVKTWQLEIANHMGRWEPTPLCDSRDAIIETLVRDFGWTLIAHA